MAKSNTKRTRKPELELRPFHEVALEILNDEGLAILIYPVPRSRVLWIADLLARNIKIPPKALTPLIRALQKVGRIYGLDGEEIFHQAVGNLLIQRTMAKAKAAASAK